MLNHYPEVKHKADELTKAMVEYYSQSQIEIYLRSISSLYLLSKRID
jgi:hypothetical protein